MPLEDRLAWLAIGCFIGFVLGYIVRLAQDIKEKVEHVDGVVTDEHESSSKRERSERGSMRPPKLSAIGLLVVVLLSVYASFQTSLVNGQLKETINCITNYNAHQGRALNGRDGAVKSGTESEIKLWTEYASLYALATKDPSMIPKAQAKLNQAIAKHRQDLIDIQRKRGNYPYPPPNVLQNCKGN